jgi:hypothetical protein
MTARRRYDPAVKDFKGRRALIGARLPQPGGPQDVPIKGRLFGAYEVV